ncbi:TetR/AcrR family transcriptional regulator [Prescottella sp. R16]|uniref:TetR/AcrR family transcriptional regulator n=1 Tax=Prescottella sp. R16 TaxID=3064529 RepID=UPI00272E2C27|nr:TetR/AcrR family transcriptional regulator [Prescottella sp. R16]
MSEPLRDRPGALASAGTQSRLTGDERRLQIIESARQVFQRSGLAGARTRDIAAAAGVNESLLYRHFRSKEQLFEAAVAAPLEEAVGRLVEISGSPPAEFDSTGDLMYERTYRFVLDLMSAMDEIGPLLGIILFGQADQAAEYFRKRIEPSLDRIRNVTNANMIAWTHREFDSDLTVRLVLGMTWFLSVSDRLGDRQRDQSETAHSITKMILSGLGPPPGHPASRE